MDYATTDLVLAIVHHLLVFMLAGVLAFEIGTVTLTMKRDEILGVGRVDNWYGILALVIVVVGFIRATVAAKGWACYEVILLGEDRHLRRRRPALNCPNGRDNSLAQCAEKRCRFCSAGNDNTTSELIESEVFRL